MSMKYHANLRAPGRGGLTAIFVVVVLSITASPASAQYGWGWGGGLFNQPNSQNVVDAINQRSLVRSQAAYADRPRPVQAPSFQSRDDSFYQKYDARTRMNMIDRVARDPRREIGTAGPSGVLAPPAVAVAAAPPLRPRVVLLANFFDRNRRLIWPAESPTAGDLVAKRSAADLAILSVLGEFESRGARRGNAGIRGGVVEPFGNAVCLRGFRACGASAGVAAAADERRAGAGPQHCDHLPVLGGLVLHRQPRGEGRVAAVRG